MNNHKPSMFSYSKFGVYLYSLNLKWISFLGKAFPFLAKPFHVYYSHNIIPSFSNISRHSKYLSTIGFSIVLLKMAIKYGVSLSLLVIQIVLSLLFSSHHFAKADNEIGKSLITTTCNHTEFPDVCISTLESDPRSFSAGLTNLSRIALELAITEANETKVEAFKLVNNAGSYESWGIRLACYDGFNSSVYQLEESLQYFDQLKYNESNRIVELFNGGLNYCINLGVAELSTRITFLRKFTTGIKAILHLLF